MPENQGFDYRTHIINPKTGKLEIEQHYKMTVSRTDGTILERPIGSGKFYHMNGEPVQKEEVKPVPLEQKKPEGK